MRIPPLVACSLALASPGFAQGPAARPIREFRLAERFGVAHPDQVVELDLGGERVGPSACRMPDDAGGEVPNQVIGGGARVAIPTDLPAGSERRWRLVAGRPAAKHAREGLQRSPDHSD